MIDDQGRQFLSISAPQTVRSPANCFILGAVHPPKGLKSLKACRLSQCAYHRGTDPTDAHAEVLPKMPCHITADEQTAGVFPLDLMTLMASVRKAQLLAASCPDHVHPALGLVSTSIQTVEQRLLGTLLISSFTWAVAFLPLQGNMQMSVDSPALRALLRLELALVSSEPGERQARTMAKELPEFLRQVKVAAEVGLAMSMPFTDSPTATRRERRRPRISISFYYQSYETCA